METVITKIKQRAAPINYSNVSVNEMGEMEQRVSLLDQRIVEGYGCIWGAKNRHNEVVYRGAYAKSIADNGPGSGASYEIKFRDEHGRACALFEVLKEDEIGLYFRTKPLDDVSWANDLLTQLRSGTINNFSNGFDYVFNDNAMVYNKNTDTIEIRQAVLIEISAVAIPSDGQTFAIRSADDQEGLYDDTNDFIKSLPRKNQLEARHLFARHKALSNQPLEQRNIAPVTEQPQTVAIDYGYLLNNI